MRPIRSGRPQPSRRLENLHDTGQGVKERTIGGQCNRKIAVGRRKRVPEPVEFFGGEFQARAFRVFQDGGPAACLGQSDDTRGGDGEGERYLGRRGATG